MHLAPSSFWGPDVIHRICAHSSTEQPAPAAQKQAESCSSFSTTHFGTETPGKWASRQSVQAGAGPGRGVGYWEKYGSHRSSLEGALARCTGMGPGWVSHALHPFPRAENQAVQEQCSRWQPIWKQEPGWEMYVHHWTYRWTNVKRDSTLPQVYRVPKPVTDDLYSVGLTQSLHRSCLVKKV